MAHFDSSRYVCMLSYDCNGSTIDYGYFSSKQRAKEWARNMKDTLLKGEDYTAKLYKKEASDFVRDTNGTAIAFETWHFHPTKEGQILTVHVK